MFIIRKKILNLISKNYIVFKTKNVNKICLIFKHYRYYFWFKIYFFKFDTCNIFWKNTKCIISHSEFGMYVNKAGVYHNIYKKDSLINRKAQKFDSTNSLAYIFLRNWWSMKYHTRNVWLTFIKTYLLYSRTYFYLPTLPIQLRQVIIIRSNVTLSFDKNTSSGLIDQSVKLLERIAKGSKMWLIEIFFNVRIL